MRPGELGERLLVGRELPGRGLAAAGKAQLAEEQLAELLGAVGVEAGVGVGEDALGEGKDLAVKLAPVLLERVDVHPHPLALHVAEYLDERLLNLGERNRTLAPLGQRQRLRTQRVLEPQGDVGVLGGIVGHLRDVLAREGRLRLAALLLARHLGEVDRAVAEVALRERVHAVARGGVEAVVGEHRVVRSGGEADAVAVEHVAVELAVVGDEHLGGVGEKRTEHVDERRVHIPRAPGLGGEGEPDQPAGRGVGRRHPRLTRGGLGVEGDARRGHQRLEELPRLLLGGNVAVVVGKVGKGGQGLWVRDSWFVARGSWLVGHGSRGSGRGGEAVLLRQTRELELRADGGELLRVGRAEAVGLPVRLDRHVGADGGEELRGHRVLAPGEHLLGELALDLADVGDDALDVAELRDEVRRGLLADAADAGDVVGRVAGEREVVDHLRGRGELPVLADLRLVVDLGGVAGVGRTVELHAGADELRGVLVGRG